MHRKIFAVTVLLVCGLLLMTSCSAPSQSNQENKKAASLLLHDMLEGKNIESLTSQYFDSNVQIEFPESFAMPHNGDHHIHGIKEFSHTIGAWKQETGHQVEIVDVIGDGDNVAVFARVDRTFKMENKVKVYKGHPYAFFFKFKDGKVVEVIGMFDVLNDVEQYKAEKYKNHKCRQ